MHAPHVLADPESQVEERNHWRYKHLASCSTLREGGPIGVMVLQRRTPLPFTDKQIELVTNFADQAVIAIENTRLLNEVQRAHGSFESLEQQTATSEVLKVISSSPGELEPVFNAMLENATRICEAKFGNLVSLRGRCLSLAAHARNTPPAYSENGEAEPVVRLRQPESPLDRVAANQTARPNCRFKGGAGLYRRRSSRRRARRSAGARTHVAVPMLKEDELVGAIAIYHQEVRPFTDKQIELVKNFAAQAVIAIENTRLLNELRKSLSTADRDGRCAQGYQPLDRRTEAGFRRILQNATRICEARFGISALREGDALRRVARHGAPTRLCHTCVMNGISSNTGERPRTCWSRMKQIVHIEDITHPSLT